MYCQTDRLFGTTDKRFSVIECSGCRLLRMHPWPTAAELQTFYPDNYWFAPQENSVSRLEERYRRFVLRDHVNFVSSAFRAEDGPLLDVGCGGALFGRLMADRGYRVFGLDYSRQAAEVAWSQNGVPVVAGDFSSAPFPNDFFAAVTMFHVLEHLYDPGSYLQAAWRSAEARGTVDRTGSERLIMAVFAFRRALEWPGCSAASDQFPRRRSSSFARELRV